MKLAIEEIPEGVSTLELVCKPAEIDLESDGVRFIDPVDIKLWLFRQIDKIFVKAEISVNIEMECARCLSAVQMILRGTSENQYRPVPKVPIGLLDDIGIGYYSGEYIDLSNDLRESLLLEIPLKVLCVEDCKGLCPRCGQDLNKGKCDCYLEPEEAHFSKFAELIKMLELNR